MEIKNNELVTHASPYFIKCASAKNDGERFKIIIDFINNVDVKFFSWNARPTGFLISSILLFTAVILTIIFYLVPDHRLAFFTSHTILGTVSLIWMSVDTYYFIKIARILDGPSKEAAHSKD